MRARWPIALVALAMLCGAVAPGCGIDEEIHNKALADIRNLNADKSQFKQQVQDLEAQLASERQQKEELQTLIAEVQGQMRKLLDEKARLAGEKSELENDMEASLGKIGELQATNVALMEKKKELEEKTRTYDDLMSKMDKEIKDGKVAISRLKGRMTVSLKDKILFSSGQVTANQEGKDALAKLAEVLVTLDDKVIQVEGHTDDDPIRSKRFPTNWELSSARALTVLRFLQTQGVDPSRLSAAGYGEFQPMAPNDTDENKSKNRRIEIVLLPDQRTTVSGGALTE